MKRRRVLGWMASSVGANVLAPFTGGALAAAKLTTPGQMRGPFYPRKFPLDKDFDLTRVAGSDGVAFGEIATVAGRVTDSDGQALEGVLIEIWQVNGYGRYHHEGDDSTNPIDPKPLWEVEGPASAVCADADNLVSGRHIDCKLGQAFGNPIITKVRADGYDQGRWVVIYASGYNNADGKGYISVRDAGR